VAALARLLCMGSRSGSRLGLDGEDAPGSGNAFEVVFAAACQGLSGADTEIADGAADEYLARSGEAADARADVDGDTADVAVGEQFALAGVHTRTDLDIKIDDAMHDLHRTADRSRGSVEGRVEAVACGGRLETAPAFEGIADDRVAVERTRAFVKVQDGCSFHCTYCIIPRARGAERSLEPGVVLADVRRALAAGHREIVLTGINIGTYDGGWSERGARGSHVRSALTLAGLIRMILAETPVERIRLSSIEPQHLDADLLETWVEGASRTLPHLHLPLQSGDGGVLRRMGRRYLPADYARVVEQARAAIPGVAVHADVIAGFPTEEDAAFARSVAFIRGLDLAGLHVFRYSARPGTPATRMAGQVDERTKKARAGELLAVAADARAGFARRSLGTVTRVLVETRLPGGRWLGHAEDHVLVAVAPRPGDPPNLENAILAVLRTAIDGEIAERVTGRTFQVQRLPLVVLKVARLVVQPFNPHLGSLLAMVLAQAVTPLALPPTPYGAFGLRATSFEEYVTEQVGAAVPSAQAARITGNG